MTATAEIPPTRAEINRRNAQRSTGPTSQAGKERSRFNALKHGCRARLPILPGEDPDAYQDRLDAWIDKFQPRDAVEAYLVERAVHASWQLDRADRAEVAGIGGGRRRAGPPAGPGCLELGATLFHAPARGPDGARGGDGDDQDPPLSWPFDPEHPRHPAHLVAELEGTAQGCTWLLQRWAALGEALDGGRTWRAVDRLRAIRLLGKQPLDAVADETVLSIYLACQAMDPHGPDVFAEPLSDLPPRGGGRVSAAGGAVRSRAGRAVAAGCGGGPGGAAGDRVGGRGAGGGPAGGPRGGGGGGRPVGGLGPVVLHRQGDGGLAVEAPGEVQPIALPDVRRAAQGPPRLRRRPAGSSRPAVRFPWSVVGP